MRKKYAICAIIKDEQRYIEEWLDYHLALGFDNITLYQDFDSTPHDDIVKKYDKVNLIPLKGNKLGIVDKHNTRNQLAAYRHFLFETKKNHNYDWVLFTDIDEYLMFEDGYDLDKLTDEYEDYTGILLCWKLYNANGHIKRPKGKIMENYTRTIKYKLNNDYQWNIKSFANINKCDDFIHIHAIKDAVHTNLEKNVHAPMNYEKAWINHYFTKSFEDHCERMFKRGNMSNNFRSFDDFFDLNPDLKHKEMELLNSIRHIHCYSTAYLSIKHKLISGGNLRTIEELNRIYP